MAQYSCMIQEGQAADSMRGELETRLRALAEATFGEKPDEVGIGWRVVKKGYGWTAGEPSTSSIVIRSVPVGLPPDEREAFMRRVCDLWEEVTGCSIQEIVVTAWDGPLPL